MYKLQKEENHHVIYQIELSELKFISQNLLELITGAEHKNFFGIKNKNLFILNAQRQINNTENSLEIEALNLLYQICSNKGFSLITLKI